MNVKRVFDVIGSLCILVLMSPLMLVVSFLILIVEGRPVLYKAKRAGRNNKIIGIYKFRTMVKNADTVGPSITYGGDSRVTKLGGFLRNTKIDELPQVVNVLKGDMSIVGPRAESLDIVSYYTPEQMGTLKVKPGLTGAGALYYYMHQQDEKVVDSDNEEYYLKYQLPAKLKLDIDYIKRYNEFGILEDLTLIMRTSYTMLLFVFRKLVQSTNYG